mmetsp:Transcript_15178/g.35892  ORF Transcript_15178/g.35892 Transcript_15178/m.35892 type:complete len:238 (-) Transcript_15178:643-1356(-)
MCITYLSTAMLVIQTGIMAGRLPRSTGAVTQSIRHAQVLGMVSYMDTGSIIMRVLPQESCMTAVPDSRIGFMVGLIQKRTGAAIITIRAVCLTTAANTTLIRGPLTNGSGAVATFKRVVQVLLCLHWAVMRRALSMERPLCASTALTGLLTTSITGRTMPADWRIVEFRWNATSAGLVQSKMPAVKYMWQLHNHTTAMQHSTISSGPGPQRRKAGVARTKARVARAITLPPLIPVQA